MISSNPPCTFTPAGSPSVWTGTVTRMRLVRSMRLRSACSRRPLIGSTCRSTTMTGVVSPPAIASVKMVLSPVVERMILLISFGLTATLTGSW